MDRKRSEDEEAPEDGGDGWDGHVNEKDPDRSYWLNEAPPEDRTPSTYYNETPVPAGPLYIVIVSDKMEFGYGRDGHPESGIWLAGKHRGCSSRPPAPIATDDDLLQEAVRYHFAAATDFVSPSNIVGITSGTPSGSLNIVVNDSSLGQELLFSSSGDEEPPSSQTGEGSGELVHGFSYIRKFGTPKEIYVNTDKPRLSLEEVEANLFSGPSAGDGT